MFSVYVTEAPDMGVGGDSSFLIFTTGSAAREMLQSWPPIPNLEAIPLKTDGTWVWITFHRRRQTDHPSPLPVVWGWGGGGG